MIKEMSKKLNIIKIFVAILLFFGLFVFSEVFYALSNEHLDNIFISYHLFQFKRNVEKGNCKKSLNHFFKLTDMVIKYRHKKNPKQIPKNYSIFSYLDIQDSCNKSFFTFESPEINYLYKSNILDANLSYIYYLSGIKAQEMGYLEIVPKLFQTAIYLNPDFSFYYIELSNYFKSIGDEVNSLNQLNVCMSFDYPKKHCEDYSQSLTNSTEYNPLGFQKESIDKYFRDEIYFSN